MTPLWQTSFQNSLPRHFWGLTIDYGWSPDGKKIGLIVLNCHFALLILAMRHHYSRQSRFEIIRGCEEINDSFYAYQMNTLKDRILQVLHAIFAPLSQLGIGLLIWCFSMRIAGVCSSIERQECHQIDHCQLVHDPSDGQCTCQDISCPRLQTNEEQPVCGSDHVTYKNQCQLKNAACGKHLNLTQIASVPCGEFSNSDRYLVLNSSYLS